MNNITFLLANVQFLGSNQPKTLSKTSFLSQIINIKDSLRNLKFLAKSKDNFKLDKKAKFFSKMLTSNVN